MIGIVRTVVAAFAVALSGGPAVAGWLTIRNDTKQELIIQPFVVVNGRPKPGLAIKLQPGEAVRENKPVAGSRGIWVFDAANPMTPLLVGNLKWEKDDVTVALTPDKQTIALTVLPPKKP